MNNRCLTPFLAVALAVLTGGTGWAAEAGGAPGEAKKDRSLAPTAALNHYVLHWSNAYFSDRSRTWMETSVKFGLKGTYGPFAAEAVGIGVKTWGTDPYGTGSVPAGAPLGTGREETVPDVQFDLFNISWQGPERFPLKATIGRQPITIGSQFLIGDGVYDGFHPARAQGVYHNPRRSFDAARLELELTPSLGRTRFDAFYYKVDPTWDGGGGRDGRLGGLDMTQTLDAIKGTYAAGIFVRTSSSKLDNDMMVANVRWEQHLPGVDDVYLSGEYAREFAGKGRNAFYVTTVGQNMNEDAWHIEVGYQANPLPFKPFIEAGYVYYSVDFTPIATGFSDWGKWYLGNQVDWIVFGTNSQVWRGQVGLWPRNNVKVRAQYHKTQQVVPTGASRGGTLSDEVSLIGEWYPTETTWVTLVAGYSIPGDALIPSGLTNPFAFLNSGTVPVGARSSLDMTFAVGWSY